MVTELVNFIINMSKPQFMQSHNTNDVSVELARQIKQLVWSLPLLPTSPFLISLKRFPIIKHQSPTQGSFMDTEAKLTSDATGGWFPTNILCGLPTKPCIGRKKQSISIPILQTSWKHFRNVILEHHKITRKNTTNSFNCNLEGLYGLLV